MELKEFVTETISNILAGITEAQKGPHGKHVNPQLRNAENVKWSGGLAAAGTGNVVSVVN